MLEIAIKNIFYNLLHDNLFTLKTSPDLTDFFVASLYTFYQHVQHILDLCDQYGERTNCKIQYFIYKFHIWPSL